MGKIVISRSAEWLNRRRSYKLKLDGQELADIKHNEIKEFEIPTGKHVLQATIDWTSSNEFEFEIADKETIYIRLSAFKHANWLIPSGNILIILYLLVLKNVFKLEGTMWEKFFWIIIVVFLAMYIYFFTLGRKRYLWLRTDIR